MQEPFVGSEAVARREVTKAELRSRYTRIFRDVYIAPGVDLTPLIRAKAGWLWTRRRGVVAGFSASALHGAKWVDEDRPVELVHDNRHLLPGLLIRGDLTTDDEIVDVEGCPVTTPERTALDLACWYPLEEAIAAIDALANASGIKLPDVELLASRCPRRRGSVNARKVFDLVDVGAESPRETWLRLLIVGAGLPRPETQFRSSIDADISSREPTWGGGTCASRSSMKVTTTERTKGNSLEISPGLNRWRLPDGSSSE